MIQVNTYFIYETEVSIEFRCSKIYFLLETYFPETGKI